MGLIKAALGAAGGVMADQWKEYFYCEAIMFQSVIAPFYRSSPRSFFAFFVFFSGRSISTYWLMTPDDRL